MTECATSCAEVENQLEEVLRSYRAGPQTVACARCAVQEIEALSEALFRAIATYHRVREQALREQGRCVGLAVDRRAGL